MQITLPYIRRISSDILIMEKTNFIGKNNNAIGYLIVWYSKENNQKIIQENGGESG